MDTDNKKNQPLELIKQAFATSASRVADNANIEINIESAIINLQNLGSLYPGRNDLKGFLTDTQAALGLFGHNGPSKYGWFSLDNQDYTIRISNHHANACRYPLNIGSNNSNVSIVISRRFKKYRFIPNEHVILDEFVYFEDRLRDVENPLNLIIDSIIEFLQTGKYTDKTGKAYKNHSPK